MSKIKTTIKSTILFAFTVTFYIKVQAQKKSDSIPKGTIVLGFDESVFPAIEVTSSSGEGNVIFRPSTQSILYVGYNREMLKRIDVEFDGGLGFQTVNFKYGTIGKQRFLNPQFYARFIGAYSLTNKSNQQLALLLGGGLNLSLGGKFSSSHTVVDYNQSSVVSSTFSYVVGSFEKFQGYGTLGLRYSHSLKNQDLLLLSLKSNLCFSKVIQGTYSLSDKASIGRFESYRPQLQLGIAYQFTRLAHYLEIERRTVLEGQPRKVISGEVRKKKRYYDPESWFVELSGGYFWMLTQDKGGQNLFESVYKNKGQWQITVEKGIGKNFYLEGSFHHQNYSTVARAHNSNFSVHLTKIKTSGISLGAGKRLINTTNYNWLNLEAGMSISLSDHEKGQLSTSVGTAQLTSSGDTLYSYNSQSYLNRRIIPLVYFGANKEFQLTKRMYISLGYQLNLGITTVLYSNIQYSNQNQSDIPTQLQVKGTAHSVKIGLKYRLNKS